MPGRRRPASASGASKSGIDRATPQLVSVAWREPRERPADGFPFDTAVVRAFDGLRFTRAVTCLVGENGSGKSTLLEAIALAAELPVAGADDGPRDPSLATQRRLADALRLGWVGRTRRGFFLRTEDFVGFVRRIQRERAALLADIARIEQEYAEADRSPAALALALGPARGSLAALEARYGADLDACSHGEGILRLLETRCVPGGVYVIDEPEAALSPQAQLAFVALILDRVAQGAQFVLASHAPIVLGIPGAALLAIEEGRLVPTPWDELPHVRLTRDFLNAPERYLRHLRAD